MRKVGVALLIVFLFMTSANAQKKVLDKIVAVVGSNIILQSDVETNYAQYLYNLGSNPPNPAIKCDIVYNLLSSKLLIQQAVIDSIAVTENDIDDEVDRRMRQSIQRAGGEDKLEQFLGKPILQYKDEIRPDVKDLLISERMRAKITEKINTTPQDVKKYFDNFPKDSLPMISKEIEVSQIVFEPKLNKEEKDYYKDKAEKLLKRVKDGEDFATLATAYSQDPGSAPEGGVVPWGDRTTFAKEYSANAFKLKAGEMSPVFESQFGYHFLQVIERRGEQVHTRHILITPPLTPASVERAKKTADSISTIIAKAKANATSTDYFANAASYYSDDKETKFNGGVVLNAQNTQVRTSLIPTESLDPQIALVVDTMKVGQISSPQLYTDQSGKKSYRIYLLKSVTDAHRANLDQDFPKLKAVAQQDKLNSAVSEWFEKKRKQTFIKIDPEYKSCPILKDWATPSITQAKL